MCRASDLIGQGDHLGGGDLPRIAGDSHKQVRMLPSTMEDARGFGHTTRFHSLLKSHHSKTCFNSALISQACRDK